MCTTQSQRIVIFHIHIPSPSTWYTSIMSIEVTDMCEFNCNWISWHAHACAFLALRLQNLFLCCVSHFFVSIFISSFPFLISHFLVPTFSSALTDWVKCVLRNNWQYCNLIGPYHIPVIGPINLTWFTRLFSSWEVWSGHDTRAEVLNVTWDLQTANARLKGQRSSRACAEFKNANWCL